MEAGLSPEEALAKRQGGGFTAPTEPARPKPLLYKGKPLSRPAELPKPRPVLKAKADLCEKEGGCSCKGLKIGYDRDKRRIVVTDCTCQCHKE